MAAESGELVKASIKNIDTGETIRLQFNPTEYEFRKSNTWSTETRKGENVPQVNFDGGSAAELSLKLLFDTYETGEDVREKYTNALARLALVNPDRIDAKSGKGRPPDCEFKWGEVWSFTAVATSINQKFTM